MSQKVRSSLGALYNPPVVPFRNMINVPYKRETRTSNIQYCFGASGHWTLVCALQVARVIPETEGRVIERLPRRLSVFLAGSRLGHYPSWTGNAKSGPILRNPSHGTCRRHSYTPTPHSNGNSPQSFLLTTKDQLQKHALADLRR